MADSEETIELMVCAFILIGIVVVAGWVIFSHTGISSHFGMSEADLKEKVGDDQFPDTLGYLKQQSAGFWLITIIASGIGIAMLYIALTEVLGWSQ